MKDETIAAYNIYTELKKLGTKVAQKRVLNFVLKRIHQECIDPNGKCNTLEDAE